MTLTILLLLGLVGALLIPSLGGDEGGDGTGEINGSLGDDNIEGTTGDDVIYAWDGADTINASTGDDFINAGLGDDTVDGGSGRDVIEGRAGNDILNGQVGNDTILGGAGNDVINGGYGSDIVRGGQGDDTIYGGYDVRDEGGVLVPALETQDTLRGEGGNDTIFVWGGDSSVYGGTEDDQLILVTGSATMTAGGGTTDAFYIFANATDDQLTDGTVTDFDPSRDTLLLTLDYVPEAGADPLPDLEISLTEETLDGINGVRVDVGFVAGGTVPADYEASTVFLGNITLADAEALVLGGAISAQATAEADLFDAAATLAAVTV